MDNIPPTRFQQTISGILDSVVAHAIIIILVLLDIVIITILLVIDVCVSQDLANDYSNCTVEHMKYERIRQTQFSIGIFQLTVLSGFLLEIIIRILSKLPAIRHDKWQVFDCLLVVVIFVLYTILLVRVSRKAVAYSIASLTSLRLWRIGRLYYVIKNETLMEADVQIRSLSDYEALLKKAQHKISLQKRQLERLEQAMLVFKSLAQASADNQIQSIPKLMEAEEEMNAANTKDVVNDLKSSLKSEIVNSSSELQTENSTLYSKSLNSSFFNEAYTRESDHHLQPSASDSTSDQVNCEYTDKVPNGSNENLSVITPDAQSGTRSLEELLQNNSHRQVPFPFEHMRSYLSQDGVPMTDL